MSFHPDDRPDPSEQPIRARVPDHVAAGCFSTGVIVMTAQTEFILDFVQNLGRPHQIVARVVMPHGVLPQLVDALGRNMQLYRGRWGELPNPNLPNQALVQAPIPGANPQPGPANPGQSHQAGPGLQPFPVGDGQQPLASNPNAPGQMAPGQMMPGQVAPTNQLPGQQAPGQQAFGSQASGQPNPAGYPGSGFQGAGSPSQNPPAENSGVRQATAQEIYDDLKIRDELLSGNYANAVMIGHGPHEFSFDFITNFYPHSAVSSRVFLAAGQIPRLYESLKGTWEQLRSRMQPPPNNPPPPTSDW